MVEQQALSLILTKQDWSLVSRYNLDESYFPAYKDEFLFIAKHHAKYGQVPDLTTFFSQFPDFDVFEIEESEIFIIEALREAKGYNLVVPAVEEINEISRKNSILAAEKMIEAGKQILSQVRGINPNVGYDVVASAFERAEEYKNRLSMKGLLGIPSNFLDLDKHTHGWLDEDFIAIAARTGEGKSWVQLYFLIQAWLCRKRVLLFSLENSKLLTGFRFDTLMEHFSNDALMTGADVLAWEDNRPTKTADDYFSYIDGLRNFDIPFIIIGAQDNGDEQFSPNDILRLIEIYKPDIIGIDQLSLLRPNEPKRTIREGYINITRAFRRMTNETHIPILLNTQASREAAKEAKKNSEATPELHQLAESDSIGQDATRIISIKQMDGLLKLSLKKNTYGRSGFEGLAKWDIDYGILKPIEIGGGDSPESMF